MKIFFTISPREEKRVATRRRFSFKYRDCDPRTRAAQNYYSLGQERTRRRDRRRVSAFKEFNHGLCVMKILEERNDANASGCANQIGLARRRLHRWFLLRILCAADASAQVARMLSIEGARDRLRKRRGLLHILHEHRRPRDRLKCDPIEADREAKCKNDEMTSYNRRHGHNATCSCVHRSTSEDKRPQYLKIAVYALLKASTRFFRRP